MPNNQSVLEKVSVKIFPDENNELSIAIAQKIAETIKNNDKNGQKTVLGLATGHTPMDVYRELVRLHQQEGLGFKNVLTFNLDEYFGLNPDDHRSYHRFMRENLFDYLDIPKENIHIPDGLIAEKEIARYCQEYEEEIAKSGGIDIQLLGIGRDGHIGFNEPGSSIESKTRLIDLDDITRRDALPDFGETQYVPQKAITMGIGTILSAKNVILIARGDHKAKIIKEAVEGPVTMKVAASFLQNHPRAIVFADKAAASELTRVKTPWLINETDWLNEKMAAKAVCYVSENLHKPLEELQEIDFQNNQIAGLLRKYPLEEIKTKIREGLIRKIKFAQDLPKQKKILIFSPHPDDDVISLGGTMQKLIVNKNQITVIYMTPGYNAVYDYVVENFILGRKWFNQLFQVNETAELIHQRILRFLEEKKLTPFGLMDNVEILKVKTIIRMVEAISACKLVGVNDYEFLEMPFYRTGGAKKMPINEQDVQIILGVFNKYQPDIIFVANDLNDPNGTHRLCLNSIERAMTVYENKPQIWFYRGAWQEFHPLEANVFVPLTMEEIKLKRMMIFRHESQKDTPPQPGASDLEFWQRAENKNKATAELLKKYGLGEYFAIEAFSIKRTNEAGSY